MGMAPGSPYGRGARTSAEVETGTCTALCIRHSGEGICTRAPVGTRLEATIQLATGQLGRPRSQKISLSIWASIGFGQRGAELGGSGRVGRGDVVGCAHARQSARWYRRPWALGRGPCPGLNKGGPDFRADR